MFSRLTIFLLSFVLFAALCAYVALPGKHRALTPRFFGMTKVANGIFVDDPARAEEVKWLATQGELNSVAFFGDLKASPRYIFCSANQCKKDFGLRGSGLTVGYHLVYIAPTGFSERILTHERVHVDLHARMGISDLWNQRFPAWFDEGLAVLLSDDNRVKNFAKPQHARWIKDMHSYREWTRMLATTDWRHAYGAAREMVAQMEMDISRDGLKKLVDEVAAGKSFDEVATTLKADKTFVHLCCN